MAHKCEQVHMSMPVCVSMPPQALFGDTRCGQQPAYKLRAYRTRFSSALRELPATETSLARAKAHLSKIQGMSGKPEPAGSSDGHSSGRPGPKHPAGSAIGPALVGHSLQRRTQEVRQRWTEPWGGMLILC
eukprot:scaffold203344_cov21-Tisochrysis_lutea.AAC.2